MQECRVLFGQSIHVYRLNRREIKDFPVNNLSRYWFQGFTTEWSVLKYRIFLVRDLPQLEVCSNTDFLWSMIYPSVKCVQIPNFPDPCDLPQLEVCLNTKFFWSVIYHSVKGVQIPNWSVIYHSVKGVQIPNFSGP